MAPIPLSIMGCVVNGPGEASQTDIDMTGAGKIVTCFIFMEYKIEKYLTKI